MPRADTGDGTSISRRRVVDLDTLADTEMMRDVVRRVIGGEEERRLVDCCVLRARCRPWQRSTTKKPLLAVTYALHLDATARGDALTQWIYAQHFPGASAERFAKFSRTSLVSPGYGPALAHVPELDLVLWGFPNDPVLSQLPELVDPLSVRARLPLPHVERSNVAVRVSVERYRAEDRCTSRYHLKTAGGLDTVLYAKTYKDDRMKAQLEPMSALWRRGRAERDAFLVPECLGYDEGTHTFWQSALPGVAFGAGPVEESRLLALANALAALHRPAGNVAGEAHVPSAKVFRKLDRLARALPRDARVFRAIRELLQQDAVHLASARKRWLHGSFRRNQLKLHGERWCVLDLDDLSAGDAYADVAALLADFHFNMPSCPGLGRSFLGSYARAMGRDVAMDRLRWHLRAECVYRAANLIVKRNLDDALRDSITRLSTLALASTVERPFLV